MKSSSPQEKNEREGSRRTAIVAGVLVLMAVVGLGLVWSLLRSVSSNPKSRTVRVDPAAVEAAAAKWVTVVEP